MIITTVQRSLNVRGASAFGVGRCGFAPVLSTLH
jgi:hypothetical protein